MRPRANAQRLRMLQGTLISNSPPKYAITCGSQSLKCLAAPERPLDGWGEQTGLGVWRPSKLRRLESKLRFKFQLGDLGLQRERVRVMGQPGRSPEAFLAQFYLYAQYNVVPPLEHARQLIRKLTVSNLVHPHVRQRPNSGHPSPRSHCQVGVAQGVRAILRVRRGWLLGLPRPVPYHCPKRVSAALGPRRASGASPVE